LRYGFPGGARLDEKIRLVEHHVGHAMSAFGPSGFSDALIFTADGFGDGISGCVLEGRDGQLTSTRGTFSVEDSLGRFYSSVLRFLGYSPGDEYKAMGLAPYGDRSRYRHFFSALYTLLPDGAFAFTTPNHEGMTERLAALGAARDPGDSFGRVHVDVAAALQEAFETIVFHIISHHRRQTGHRNLCLAGGTAQNSTSNGRLLASGLFERIYVQPAAHDAGIALGAALHLWASERPPERVLFSGPDHIYWGPELPDASDMAVTLRSWGEFIRFERCSDVFAATAALLAEGAIVGWIQGRSEFGPRALGNRSVLADPRRAENRDLVNNAVKLREQFRPFAPSVLEESAAEFFTLSPGQRLPFMTFVTDVREDRRALLPAVTHVDGSARVQTVARADNERFWRLLHAFADLTGVPVLLNTSFNRDGEPIVDSLEDAIVCFLTGGLDILVAGDCIVRKRPIRPAAYAGLVASLRTDSFLERHYERVAAARGRPLHGILLRKRRRVEISSLLHRILSLDHMQRRAVELIAGEEGATQLDLDLLGRELFGLWACRIITLRPFSRLAD
jgi:carbamoyltransferase